MRLLAIAILSLSLTACSDDGDTGTTDAAARADAAAGADANPTPDSADGTDATAADASQAADASPSVNGCSLDTATDARGTVGNVVITNTSAWSIGHKACVIVSPGATVVWQGNFATHPLVGGVSPTTDGTSPITQATPSNGSTSVTFANAGTFPYFCAIHTSSMRGVVFVMQ